MKITIIMNTIIKTIAIKDRKKTTLKWRKTENMIKYDKLNLIFWIFIG